MDEKAIWETQVIKGTGATEVDGSVAQYTGGLKKVLTCVYLFTMCIMMISNKFIVGRM